MNAAESAVLIRDMNTSLGRLQTMVTELDPTRTPRPSRT